MNEVGIIAGLRYRRTLVSRLSGIISVVRTLYSSELITALNDV